MLNGKNLLAYLKELPADRIFDWVQQQDKYSLSESVLHLLEERNEYLIDLAIALYVEDSDVGERIYSKGDGDIKNAVLSGNSLSGSIGNDWVYSSGLLQDLIDDNEKELLETYIQNEHICDQTMLDLFSREGVFENISTELWEGVLIDAAKNKNLQKKCEGWFPDFQDDYGFSDWKVIDSTWGLFAKLEVTERNAQILAYFSKSLYRQKPKHFDVLKIANNWHHPDETASYTDPYFQCRTHLADLIHESQKELSLSEDIAFRCSYYRRSRFNDTSELQKLYDTDSKLFIESVLRNENIYIRENLRRWLSDKCSEIDRQGSGMSCINLDEFQRREQSLMDLHPEWFEETYGDSVDRLVSDSVRKSEIQQKIVTTKLNAIMDKVDMLSEHLGDSGRKCNDGQLDSIEDEVRECSVVLTSVARSLEYQTEQLNVVDENNSSISQKVWDIQASITQLVSSQKGVFVPLVYVMVGICVGYFFAVN